MELGFWIVISSGILDSLSCIPTSKAQDSGFHQPNFSDSGIQMQNPDSVCVWSRVVMGVGTANIILKCPSKNKIDKIPEYVGQFRKE